MSAFWVLDYLLLALILTSAVLVVRLRNLNGAVMALSAAGTLLSVLFIVLGAPDVAHAEVVVGAIALPVLYLLAIGKSRTVVDDRHLMKPASMTAQPPDRRARHEATEHEPLAPALAGSRSIRGRHGRRPGCGDGRNTARARGAAGDRPVRARR